MEPSREMRDTGREESVHLSNTFQARLLTCILQQMKKECLQMLADTETEFWEPFLLCCLHKVTGRKMGKTIAEPAEVGDVIITIQPSRKKDRSLWCNDYEAVRAGERRERSVAQDLPVLYGMMHAATKRKQMNQVTHRRQVNPTRSNTQKRQLYGAPVRRK